MSNKILLYIIITLQLCSCNSVGWKTKSFDLMSKNQVNCFNTFINHGYEDIRYIKNKEFRKVSKILRKKYNATYIRNIFYIESKEQYYCEFNINNYTIHCLLIDKDLNPIDFEEIIFDI